MVLLNWQLHWSVNLFIMSVFLSVYVENLLGCRVAPSNAKSWRRHCEHDILCMNALKHRVKFNYLDYSDVAIGGSGGNGPQSRKIRMVGT